MKIQYRSNICRWKYKILATGSSDNHFHLLLLFLYRVYTIESNICVVVWDLGLSNKNLAQLYNSKKYIQCNNIKIIIRYFNYSQYPDHFNINIEAGYYSWKPFVIWDTYTEFKRDVLWLDCGCYIYKKLDNEYKDIKNKKFYTIIAQDLTIKQKTHIDVIKMLNVRKNLYNKTMCAAGVVGIYYFSSIVNNIFNIWKACALIRNCISPPGSNKSNHLQDQSILSILLHQNNISFSLNIRKNYIVHFDWRYNKYKDDSFRKFVIATKLKE